ncbi:MAG: pyruvate, phosphate dikinase [Acidobacteria bacterium]|nr:pyruvate, phosphate dikinase [Acidobacteriota bacterium]
MAVKRTTKSAGRPTVGRAAAKPAARKPAARKPAARKPAARRAPAAKTTARATKLVYDFSEGNRNMKDLLGGKGANLAEMANLGLPVPPGFTITTEACREYMKRGTVPAGLMGEVDSHLALLEKTMGRRLGDADSPLLVSVRSGAKFSMPGMMDTVLNLGMNDDSVHGLARAGGNERFAWDSYRRFIQMFGRIVMGVAGQRFEHALDEAKKRRRVAADTGLEARDLRELVEEFRRIVKEDTGREFPQPPREQLEMAITAVFDSWNGERARIYRRQEKISDDLGTAVNVVAMVFGNLGEDSGTGVAFTRDPATGERGLYGDYLENAQGEDVVAGIRNTLPLQDLERINPKAFRRLVKIMRTLERHYHDMCDIEFTIERGKLWMLQTRVGKRTAAAAVKLAVDMTGERLIDRQEAVRRVTPEQLDQLLHPQVDEAAAGLEAVGRGLAASPGAAVGRAVFDAARAEEQAGKGERVILVRRETNPDDLGGMIAARGILTSRGGKTSHAAVVARGMGKPCVCGAEALDVNEAKREFRAGQTTVREGDLISIDGTSGKVYLGEVPLREPEMSGEFATLLSWADAIRRLKVRANADTPEDARKAREFGAQGIGLARTEHMFLGERRPLVEKLILAANERQEKAALDALLPLQRRDFEGILEAMDGLPVTIRLLDPPLHEFLPSLVDLTREIASAEAKGWKVTEEKRRLLAAVERMHESNPMLGMRGVRLGVMKPGLYAMQVRAILEAACALEARGKNPVVEIMIPLVALGEEIRRSRAEVERVAEEVIAETGVRVAYMIGTMIELPRAAVVAGEIAETAEFFSFGTNDLTQTTFGFSRDDVAKILDVYQTHGVLKVDPFTSIDRDGVGELMRWATERGRAVRPNLKVGICGEHGGDPESVGFCHEIGLDYVSCSPFRVPLARLAAAHSALGRVEAASK